MVGQRFVRLESESPWEPSGLIFSNSFSAKGYCSPYWNCDWIDLSAIAAPLIAGLLYGVHPIDVIVFVTVPLIWVVAFLATYHSRPSCDDRRSNHCLT